MLFYTFAKPVLVSGRVHTILSLTDSLRECLSCFAFAHCGSFLSGWEEGAGYNKGIVSHNSSFRNRNVVFSEVSLLRNELFEGFSLNEPLFSDIESKRTLWEAV